VDQASRSASFRRRTNKIEAENRRLAFRELKIHPGLCPSRASVRHRSRRPVEIRPMLHGLEAFEEMVLVSRPKFVAMAQAILRNREDAEDAVQNAFLSGYLHLPSFEGRSALTTWFTRIVLNAALMMLRKRKSAWKGYQPETGAPDDLAWLQKIPTSQPDPEMIYAEHETFQFVRGVLEKLNPALRQAFTVTYFDEMSGSDARAVLGISKAAFKSRLLRARRFLHQAQRTREARRISAQPSANLR
jgi:RNA polymerase sigma-70 factor (ECF subfamily)